MRVTPLLLFLAVTVSTAGCIENMADLKEALGVVPEEPEIVPLAEPTWLPPLARAQANATSVLAGVPVRFTSEGTRDPQSLPLAYRWDFGDGSTAAGPTAVHAFFDAGEYAVRLTVANDKGLDDVSTLTIQVGAAGRAPTACFQIADASGRPAASAEAGASLLFDAACSADPDGGLLVYEWEFGDGATAAGQKVSHAFAGPGLHAAKLRVRDASGLGAETARSVAVDYSARHEGAFELMGPTSRAHEVPVAAGAKNLEITLSFPAGLGGNDLVLLLKDARGEELDRTSEGTPPGAQDVQERSLVLTAADLAKYPAGTWTVEVSKAKGLTVEYEIEVRETF